MPAVVDILLEQGRANAHDHVALVLLPTITGFRIRPAYEAAWQFTIDTLPVVVSTSISSPTAPSCQWTLAMLTFIIKDAISFWTLKYTFAGQLGELSF
ncbi:MAG: hypothetical protein R2849_22760 [Thermomicrobiales bacterium]